MGKSYNYKPSLKRCFNCKYRTESFKVGKITSYHCWAPSWVLKHENGVDISPWDTLVSFYHTCNEHKFR